MDRERIMTGTNEHDGPTLRERIDDALFYIDTTDGGEAWLIVDEILVAIYRAIKFDARFRNLTHDEFDTLTADVRERAGRDLDERIDGLVELSDIERAIDRELPQSETEDLDT